ncbi:MAG: 3-hydroxyacyl-CoA dehydrogenase NAD-binding domain-containing protein [Chloroflexota bacterium]|nr:3-hydroxyacyl-CoA dehydrogenase NAD-binding domain-containing protein [Chloroflexota bacterium]
MRLHDQTEEQLQQALDHIRANLGELEQKGRISSQDAAATVTRIRTETGLQAAVADSSIRSQSSRRRLACTPSSATCAS